MSNPRRNSDAFGQDEFGDFIIRRRILPVWQLLALFLLSFTFLYIVTTNAATLGGDLGIALAILAVIGPLTWFTIYFSQQNRDMLLAAEFQNALFSAAARIKSKFVMIVKQDGTIFYYDRDFQNVFPETRNRGMLMIDKLFNNKQISAMESQKLQAALEEGHSETVFAHLPDGAGGEQKVIITIDPLPRPSGFYIVRGRDYVTKRREQGERSAEGSADPTAALTRLLHAIPYGAYSTDAQGRLQFINPQLEHWLGFAPGEVQQRGLALPDLLAQQNTPLLEQVLARDAEGDILFLTRDGQPVRLHMQQEITADAQGTVLGSIALLQPERSGAAQIAPAGAIAAARQPERGDDIPASGILSGNPER